MVLSVSKNVCVYLVQRADGEDLPATPGRGGRRRFSAARAGGGLDGHPEGIGVARLKEGGQEVVHILGNYPVARARRGWPRAPIPEGTGSV